MLLKSKRTEGFTSEDIERLIYLVHLGTRGDTT